MKPLCDRCAIAWDNAKNPVKGEGHSPRTAKLTVVLEYPGRSELLYGLPLAGQMGREVVYALGLAGLEKSKLWVTFACACKPPGNGLKEYTTKLALRQRRGQAPKNLLDPLTACQPRLMAEIEQSNNLLLLGSLACKPLKIDGSSEEGLKTARGFPTEFKVPSSSKVIPTLVSWSPNYVLHARRFTSIWHGDLAKAVRMTEKQLAWSNPEMIFFPSAEQLANLLVQEENRGNLIAYDVETDGIEPLTANLRCIGIGSHKATACVPIKSVELHGYTYPPEERVRVERVLENFFKRPGVVAAQNGLYDFACMKKAFPWWNPKKRFFDTAIAHHVIYSELPHNLEFLSAQYSDSPAHKDVDHAAWKSDKELHHYCMLDVAITSQAASIMSCDARLSGQIKAFQSDCFLSTFCREMHRVGIEINRDIRDQLYHEQTLIMEQTKKKVQILAVRAVEKFGSGNNVHLKIARELNPGSPDQIASILYDSCGVALLPEKEGGVTDAGKPAVGKSVLFALMDRGIPPEIEDFLHEIITYKEAQKLRGTYCTLQPEKDGRIHASWSPHTVVSGRLSCSNPNLMNIPKGMRTMFVPAEGHIFVVRDKKQLEARITAWLAKEHKQIEAFIKDADIHKVNAVDIFSLKSVADVTKPMRQFTKTLVYAIQYLASKRKAWQMIRCYRERDGSRPYKDRSFAEIEVMIDRYWKGHKATLEFHKNNRALWQSRGYLEDAIHGRRRYFLDGADSPTLKEEQANMIIQTTAASDVNNATKRLVEALPYGFDGPNTGVIHQCHDALLVECRIESAEKVAKIMREQMDSFLEDMPLNTDCQVGMSYGTLKEGVYE